MKAAIFVVCSLAAGVLGTCPYSGWKEHGESCYVEMTIKKEWNDAKSYCYNNYPLSHLVRIDDSSENSFVYSMGKGDDSFWLGGNDQDQEGKTDY